MRVNLTSYIAEEQQAQVLISDALPASLLKKEGQPKQEIERVVTIFIKDNFVTMSTRVQVSSAGILPDQ